MTVMIILILITTVIIIKQRMTWKREEMGEEVTPYVS